MRRCSSATVSTGKYCSCTQRDSRSCVSFNFSAECMSQLPKTSVQLESVHCVLCWLHSLLCAIVVYCAKLPKPVNGNISTRSVFYSTQVVVKCDLGFILADRRIEKTLMCMDDSNWNDTSDTNCQRKSHAWCRLKPTCLRPVCPTTTGSNVSIRIQRIIECLHFYEYEMNAITCTYAHCLVDDYQLHMVHFDPELVSLREILWNFRLV